MKFEITNRWTGSLLFELDGESLKLAVEAAVEQSADLSGANLRSADLSGANLGGANLRSADLGSANLRSADLRSANLSGANLGGANLRSADLSGANLRSADLRSANLGGANLRSANLRSANLTPIRDDIWAVLSSAPREAEGLLKALNEGRVDGSSYEGECACLVGTLANAAECDHYSLPGLRPDSNRPAERFFLAINKGDTPETSEACKLAAQWVEEWITRMRAAFTPEAAQQ